MCDLMRVIGSEGLAIEAPRLGWGNGGAFRLVIFGTFWLSISELQDLECDVTLKYKYPSDAKLF
jgi:hypothetical protein